MRLEDYERSRQAAVNEAAALGLPIVFPSGTPFGQSAPIAEYTADDFADGLNTAMKAARGVVEVCLQGHVAAGPVSLACVGLASAGLTLAGKLIGKKAAQFDEPELANMARIVGGLAHLAGTASTVGNIAGTVEDPAGAAETWIVNAQADSDNSAELASKQQRFEKIFETLASIEKQEPGSAAKLGSAAGPEQPQCAAE